MKHILLATTALVATAGVASAEVALSGSAEMGIVGGSDIETQFHTDIDVTFTMSGETDNGLTFGASIDLDESNDADAFTASSQGGETIFIAYGPAKLTMGDVDGAFDAAMQEAIIGSAIADDHEHGGYSGNGGLDGAYDGQIAQFSYAASGFTGYVSVELYDEFEADVDPIWGVGVKYNAELSGVDLTVGLGYQSGDEDFAESNFAGIDTSDIDSIADAFDAIDAGLRTDIWGISLGATFGSGFQAILNYSVASTFDGTVDFDFDGDLVTDLSIDTGEDEKHFGLALGYSMNALTIGVNYGKYTDFLGVDGLDSKGYGLAVDYDLGGGAEVQFGYGKSELEFDGESEDTDTWSLGVAMSF